MTIPRDRLYLHEEVLLLGLDEEKGTAGCGSMYRFALGGAVVTELLVHDRVRLDQEGRKNRLTVIDPQPIGEPCLDACLELMRSAKRPASAKTWVGRFANAKDARAASLERLCTRGVLRADQRRFLVLFSRTVFPEVDPGPERELRSRLEHAITQSHAAVDDRTAMLIAIAAPAGLLRNAFGKAMIKRHKARIKALAEGHPAGDATKAAIEAVQAAVIAASAAASVATMT